MKFFCLMYVKCYFIALFLILLTDGYCIASANSVKKENFCINYLNNNHLNKVTSEEKDIYLLISKEVHQKRFLNHNETVNPIILGITTDTGDDTVDGITNDKNFSLYGNAPPEAIVSIFKSEILVGQTLTDVMGNWQFASSDINYVEGVYSFIITATDPDGNTGSPSEPYQVTIDITPPDSPNIFSVDAEKVLMPNDPGNQNHVFILSGSAEPNSKVSIIRSDFGLLDSTLADLNGNWTFTSQPELVKGEFTFSAICTDLAGNKSLPGNSVSIAIDLDGPEINVKSDFSFPTNLQTIPITINFSEPVFGFEESDVIVTGAVIDNFIGSDQKFTLNLINLVNGEVTINVPAGSVSDSSGNTNEISNTFKFVFDNIQPELQISSLYDFETNENPLIYKIDLSENINAVNKDDIIVNNGTISEILHNENEILLYVIPQQEGEVSIKISAGVIHDLAGNENLESEEYSIIYDSTRPFLIFNSVVEMYTNKDKIPVAIELNESVTGISAESFLVTGGTINDFTGYGRNFSFNIFPSGEGRITTILLKNAFKDLAGNFNVSDTLSVVYDTTGPNVIISGDTRTGLSPIPVNLTYNEDVLSFNQNDITVTGGNIVGFSGSGHEFFINILPEADGIISINIEADQLTDLAGNGNKASEIFSIFYDGTLPTAVFTSDITSPSTEVSVPINLNFSEPIFEIAKEHLQISGGEIENFQGNGTNFTFNIINFTTDTILVYLPSETVKDLAGNFNTASDTFMFVYINPFLNIKISSTVGLQTNQNIIPVQFNFSKEAYGFDSSDIVANGGKIHNFKGEGNNFSAEIIPDGEGFITLIIPEGSAHTDEGIANKVSNEFKVEFDITPPVVTISSEVLSPTNKPLLNIKLTFSETIFRIDTGLIVVSNAELKSFEGKELEYSFKLIPTADGMITIELPQEIFLDLAGNANISSSGYTIIYDSKEPVILLSTDVKSPTKLNTIPVKIQFSEEISDFTPSDISISGGTIDNFAGSGSIYTINVLPVLNGEIKIYIPKDVAEDKAGNFNSASNVISLIYDALSPMATISSPYPNPTYRKVIPIHINFSEDISNFSIEDIEVTGGVKNNFKGSGKLYTLDVSATEDGLIEIEFPAAVAEDIAGNSNLAPDPFVIRYYTCDPAYIIKDISDFKICAGESAILAIEVGGANLEYIWQVDTGNDEGFTDIEDDQIFTGSKTSSLKINNVTSTMDNYIFQCLITGNCKPSAVTNSVVMKVNPVPEVTFSLSENSSMCLDSFHITLSGGLPVGGNYSGTGVSEGNFHPSIAGFGEHEINYHYTDTNGCFSDKNEIIKVSACLGIEDNFKNNLISVFPNPFLNTINIKCSLNNKTDFELINFSGTTLFRSTISSEVQEIDVRNLVSGIYLIRFMQNEKTIKEEKIVKY